MEALLTIPSVLIRLMAMAWTIVMVVRSRDWRLSFLPVLLLIMALQPMLPHLSQWDSMVMQVSVLTVLVVTMICVLARGKGRHWGGTPLRGLLMLVTLYQTVALLTGSWAITLGPSHSGILGQPFAVSYRCIVRAAVQRTPGRRATRSRPGFA